MSAIGSKWFGEGEKYARAIFTLASKISPCVIFIDEVDRYPSLPFHFLFFMHAHIAISIVFWGVEKKQGNMKQ